MAVSLHQLLKTMTEMGGTDLHVTTNSAPQIRVDGKLRPLDLPALTAVETKQLAYSVLTDAQKHRFEDSLELDFSFGIKGLARFRANVFMQRGAVAAVYRTIPYEIRSFKELGLPPVISQICEKPRGLVLVTGPTGSGKSTTLAAMLDKINKERREHIITIEDPIEYLHNHQGCLVNQREVHSDTHAFANALRAALRARNRSSPLSARAADGWRARSAPCRARTDAPSRPRSRAGRRADGRSTAARCRTASRARAAPWRCRRPARARPRAWAGR